MSDEPDAATLARQYGCKHSFIRRWPTEPYACPHCGVPEKKWDEMKLSQMAASLGYRP